MGFLGGAGLIFYFLREIVRTFPEVWSTRSWYRRRAKIPTGKNAHDLSIAWVGSNLDEVNGIALSSRKLLATLRKSGKSVWLYGVAFHTRTPRVEGESGSVIMAPGPYSVDQAGYASSELAIVDLRHFCRFLREKKIDLIEFETPGPVEALCLWACRIIGIPTCSHYRTDIYTYAEMLVDNSVGVRLIQAWTRWMTQLAGPVIVPSEAYRHKVAAMGIPMDRIYKLARGVDLASFHPERKTADAWRKLGLPESSHRLLYVGRISKEKNLEVLVSALTSLGGKRRDFHMAVVGDGPYREEMETLLKPTGVATFTGILTGDMLYDIFASAHLFLFPSTTDTFGNSVIEALASGLPCLVSDRGGPQEIIHQGECGYVFDSSDPLSFEASLESALRHTENLSGMRLKARDHALKFTFENSARDFWNFYTGILAGSG